MTTFKDRLISLFNQDTKPSHMAAAIGMSIPGFMRIFNDGFIPKADGLIKIHEVTGCNLTWLLTGEGMPYPSAKRHFGSDVQGNGAQATYDVFGHRVDLDEFVFIPRFTLPTEDRLGKSGKRYDEKTLTLAFRKYWIEKQLHANPQDLSVVVVNDDSMESVLNNGDCVLVNHNKNRPGAGLYVISIGDRLLVKRIQPMPGSKLLMTSENKAYSPFELDTSSPADDVSIIGKVEWLGHQT